MNNLHKRRDDDNTFPAVVFGEITDTGAQRPSSQALSMDPFCPEYPMLSDVHPL